MQTVHLWPVIHIEPPSSETLRPPQDSLCSPCWFYHSSLSDGCCPLGFEGRVEVRNIFWELVLFFIHGGHCPLDLLGRLKDFGALLAFKSHISTNFLFVSLPRYIRDAPRASGNLSATSATGKTMHERMYTQADRSVDVEKAHT